MTRARALCLLLALVLAGCPEKGGSVAATTNAAPLRVVCYCALDREFAEPLLDAFTKETGIQVDAKWDAEATKTTGLVQALLAEKDRPRCDVLWSNEAAQAALLAQEGILEKAPDLAKQAKSRAQDPEARWIGFAARARVLIVHAPSVAEADRPRSIEDLANARWKGRTGIANPLFGSTAAHLAALVATRGEEWTRGWLKRMKANGVAVCAGNGDVKNRVASGELAFGLTDSDDANVARLDQKPVVMVFPDQGKDEPGTLLLPNAVGLVKGAPRAEAAAKLAAWLLRPAVEETLARGRSAQVPLLEGDTKNPSWIPAELKAITVDWAKAAASFAKARALVKEELLGS